MDQVPYTTSCSIMVHPVANLVQVVENHLFRWASFITEIHDEQPN